MSFCKVILTSFDNDPKGRMIDSSAAVRERCYRSYAMAKRLVIKSWSGKSLPPGARPKLKWITKNILIVKHEYGIENYLFIPVGWHEDIVHTRRERHKKKLKKMRVSKRAAEVHRAIRRSNAKK